MRAAPRVLLALLLASNLARAAEDLATCARIEDKNQRLDCYDRVSGRTPPQTQPAPGAAQPAPTLPWLQRAPTLQESTRAGKSLLGEIWALDEPPKPQQPITLSTHYANYLVGRYTDHVNGDPSSPTHPRAATDVPNLNPGEAKFQLSFKARVLALEDARAALWLAYTQQSYWQIGNAPLSRPFRETDYQPEAIVALSPDREWDGWRWRLLNLGFVHQSNGRGNPLSRSWNRVYAQFGVERENFAVLLRPWYRFRERYEDDDMPDIHQYYGSGDVVMVYRRDGHTITFTGRLNPSTGLGAAQLEYSTPRWKWLGPFRLYVHAFSGYGESLIDYNWRQNSIGVGVSLDEFEP
jgi:phospholipase A1